MIRIALLLLVLWLSTQSIVRAQDSTRSPPLTARERSAVGCYRVLIRGEHVNPFDIDLDSTPGPVIPAWRHTANERPRERWSTYVVLSPKPSEPGTGGAFWFPNRNSTPDSLNILIYGGIDVGLSMHLAIYRDSLSGFYESWDPGGGPPYRDPVTATPISCQLEQWFR